MIFVVIAQLGWDTQAQQDQIHDLVEAGRLGKTQWTPGRNDIGPNAAGPFGNFIRVEFSQKVNADKTWDDIKAFFVGTPPREFSRWRRLDCSWDDLDPTVQSCVVVQEQIVQVGGVVLTRP